MRLTTLVFLAVIALVSPILADFRSYSGYKVYRVSVTSEKDAASLSAIEESGLYDFWTEVKKSGFVDIMVEPQMESELKKTVSRHDLKSSVMIEDVQALIDDEQKNEEMNGMLKIMREYKMDWVSYHPLEDIYEYFDVLEAKYEWVTSEIIGQSTEGRDLRVLKLCKDGCGQKPAMFIDGGIHAREWISPATVTFMINELTENLDAATNGDLLDDLDWYFLPSVNPDGYAYTRSDDRLWRKTRSQYDDSTCTGVDANRNYGYKFASGGASNNPCTETYHGPEAFSEPESTAVKGFVDANKDELIFYNNIHSYSQLILTPWGYTDELIGDYDDVKDVADKANAALFATHGEAYEVGCIPCVLYVASGNSIDYTYGAAGIKYSYSIELRDTGSYGFLLPADQIIPTGEETFAFHATAAREILAKEGQKENNKDIL